MKRYARAHAHLILIVLSLGLLAYIQRRSDVGRKLEVQRAQEHTAQKPVDVDWTPYRISDGIMHYPGAPGCTEFPGSLVCLYQNLTRQKGDLHALLDVLDSLERKRNQPIQTNGNTVVVHLRLGDGLCARIDWECRGNVSSVPNCWESDSDCWRDPVSKHQYAFSKMWYFSVAHQLSPKREIVIVSDVHHWTRGGGDPRNGDFSVDKLYRQHVADFFTSFGHTVSVREASPPDDDFMYMCRARTYVQSGGGLSSLIGSIVSLRGGVVIKPSLSMDY